MTDTRKEARLNKGQAKCLYAMMDILSTQEEGYYICFAPVMAQTTMTRREVRRFIRALARKGFAEYGKGLSNEEGEFRGSGYRPTKRGWEYNDKP